MSNKNEEKEKITISNHFNQDNVQNYLDQILGDKKNSFVSNVVALSESSPELKKCAPSDLMLCALNATALDLPLNKNLGYAYIIPYKKNKKVNNKWVQTTEPQFQIGYKGFVQLALRSGQYVALNVTDVKEGEMVRNKLTGGAEFIQEIPDNPIIGYLAYFKLKNGFEQSFFMSNEDIVAHRDQYSQSGKGGKGIWLSNPTAMAKKTVLKLLLSRFGILSVEMQKAIEVDQTGPNGEYFDNPNTIIIDEEPEQIKAPEQEKNEVDPFENPEIAIVEEENTLDFF